MRIDQVLVSASPGDALTNFALTLRELVSKDARSDIYALYYDEQLKDDVLPLSDYGSRKKGHTGRDILVFHASIGEPEVANFVQERRERLILIYHNISPSEPFRPYDPGFADLLDEGRRDLIRLRERASAVLTVSEYNAHELRALGYRDVQVLPLIVDPAVLKSTPPDPAMTERLRNQIAGPVILSVGQILPHKRVDFLIEAFHILSTYLVPEAHLILVGHQRLLGYSAAVQTQIDELHLERAWITGSVSQEMLTALLRRSDVFATASEHEGFCVPLLEAMSFDLPFMARRFTAIPETAGRAGLLLDADDGPAVAAEALAVLLADGAVRERLIERGRERLGDFDTGRSAAAWRGALMSPA